MESEHQVPIWFFIGLMLLVYGVMIFGSGVYLYQYPPPEDQRVKLFEYHADIWWGLLMAALGLLYTVRFNPFKKAEPAEPSKT